MEFQEFFRRNKGSWIGEYLCPSQGPSSRAAFPFPGSTSQAPHGMGNPVLAPLSTQCLRACLVVST